MRKSVDWYFTLYWGAVAILLPIFSMVGTTAMTPRYARDMLFLFSALASVCIFGFGKIKDKRLGLFAGAFLLIGFVGSYDITHFTSIIHLLLISAFLVCLGQYR